MCFSGYFVVGPVPLLVFWASTLTLGQARRGFGAWSEVKHFQECPKSQVGFGFSVFRACAHLGFG